MNPADALATLTQAALREAKTIDDRLAIYDAVALLGANVGAVDLAMMATAAAAAIRTADQMQLRFRELLGGDGK